MKSLLKKLERKSNSETTFRKRRIFNRPKFIARDLRLLVDFEKITAIWLHSDDSVFIVEASGDERIDAGSATESISSISTNATMDNIPGTGRTIDMHFYQPVGRVIERFALNIGMRLNICHPSPAHILRFIESPESGWLMFGSVEKLSEVIDRISAKRPTAVSGILSLVQQSQ